MIKYEKELGVEFWKKCTSKDGFRFAVDMLDWFKEKTDILLSRQMDEDNKRFLGMISGLELLKRNTPNPLKMDIVHSHGELERMRSNKMFNEAINFVSLELRDKINKK